MIETISDNLPSMVKAVLQNTDHLPGWRYRWGLIVDRQSGNVTLTRRVDSSRGAMWIDLPRADAVGFGLPAWAWGPSPLRPEGADVRRLREDAARDALTHWGRQVFAAISPALAADRPDQAPCRECGQQTNPIEAWVDVHLCAHCCEQATRTSVA